MSDLAVLNLGVVETAMRGNAAALRCLTEYQPAGGQGDKIFPPTYKVDKDDKDVKDVKYALENRWVDEEVVPCVILDSVQSQANRMELALQDALEAGALLLPLLVVEFMDEALLKPFRVTSLDAPHRAADAIFRDSLLNGVMFRDSDHGKALISADLRNATPLFGVCPTALIFGLWDSTGPLGGNGAKFQRAMVSEMVGYHATPGVKTASRIDPLGIMTGSAIIYESKDGWTLDEQNALRDKGGNPLKKKTGKPSEINHGNVVPSVEAGGFTISKALQTTVLSLAALRRLRFPLNGAASSSPEVDCAARTALAAIALAGASLFRAQGADLRSRCQLFPTASFVWELLNDPDAAPTRYSLPADDALEMASQAIEKAKSMGLPWQGEIRLTPSKKLMELLKKSQALAAASGEGEE